MNVFCSASIPSPSDRRRISEYHFFNSLANHKILDVTKLNELADNKLNVIQNFRFALARVENIVGKGANAGYQHFLLFPPCFQKSFYLLSLKVEIVW